MRCVDPFIKAGEAFPCGKCLPCRKVKAWTWCSRIILEASQHDHTSVVTLTYDECALPESGSLSSDDFALWLKRIRKRSLERYPWRYLRFYGVGEYGEKEGRPHYHVVLFGQPGCSSGRNGRCWCSDCGCDTCQDISSSWNVGASSVDVLTRPSAMYVAGYVTRKLARWSDGKRQAPFTRMSLAPGIGAAAMDDVASTVLQYNLAIPSRLESGTGSLLLGRYLRKRLEERTDAEAVGYVLSKAMSDVRDYAWSHSVSQRSVFREINAAYASTLEQRALYEEKGL